MARTNKKGELFSHLTAFAVYRDNPGLNTTLSAAEAAGQTQLSITSSTNAADNDYHRVGADEDMEIIQQLGAAGGGPDITSNWAIGRDHASGEAVVEQVRTELGHITDEGVRFPFEADGEVIRSAIRRLELGQLLGHVGIVFEVGLEGYNLENIATALGMLESRMLGSGTEAAPHNLFIDAAQIQEQNNLAFEAVGVRKDGVIQRVQFLGVELDPSALQLSLSRGKLAPVMIRGRVTSGIRLLSNTA